MWKAIARRVRAGVCILLPMVWIDAGGAPQTHTAGLSLNAAIARTLQHNPQLLAFQHHLTGLGGRVQQAGLPPNPELSIAVEDALGTGDLKGLSGAETTISLGWFFERGLRERRVEAALAQVSVSTLEAEEQRIDVAAETARRFVDLLAYQTYALSADDATRLAEENVSEVRRRVEAGRTASADLARAEAALASSRLGQEDISHELKSARRRLAAQWGATEPDFAIAAADASAQPQIVAFEQLRERALHSPEMIRYQSRQGLNEAALRLAEAERRPVWQGRLGVRRNEGSGDHALVASITMPLSLRNRNEGRIAEVRADIDETSAESYAARVRVETMLFVLYEGLQHSMHKSHTLRTEVIPRLETALDETRNAYQLGRYAYSDLHNVQAEVIETRRALIGANIDTHRAVIEIERLTGMRMLIGGAQ